MVDPINAATKLFVEAKEEEEKCAMTEYKKEIKSLLRKKRTAATLLKNIENEITDLQIKINAELK